VRGVAKAGMRGALAIALAFGLALVGCEDRPPAMTMAADEVVDAITDYSERGCACETDKECFRTVRDEWDTAKREIVKNARLLTGDDRTAYEDARLRFGLCGDGAGLAVFDRW
jgi:hypothetical protein